MSFCTKTDAKKISTMAGTLYEMSEKLQAMVEAYQDKLDGRSERWMESEAGEAAQEFFSGLEEAWSDAEALAENLESLAADED